MLRRPSDKAREEIEPLAAEALARHDGPDLARVFDKYGCAVCDRRVLVVEPNLLPQRARRDACKAWTTISTAASGRSCGQTA